jgi:hypothetical protein
VAHRHGHAWRDKATLGGLCTPERGRLLTACPFLRPTRPGGRHLGWHALEVLASFLHPLKYYNVLLYPHCMLNTTGVVARPAPFHRQGTGRGREPHESRVLRGSLTPGRLTGVGLGVGQILDALGDNLTGAARLSLLLPSPPLQASLDQDATAFVQRGADPLGPWCRRCRVPGSLPAARAHCLAWGGGLWDERQRQSAVPASPAQGVLSGTQPRTERARVSWTFIVHTRACCRALYTILVLGRRTLSLC